VTSEREQEIREKANRVGLQKWIFDPSDVLYILTELDALRESNQQLVNSLLKFGGKNAGHIWGLTNCCACGELDNDYYFIGKKTLCQQCFDSFPETFKKQSDQLKAENQRLSEAHEAAQHYKAENEKLKSAFHAVSRDYSNSVADNDRLSERVDNWRASVQEVFGPLSESEKKDALAYSDMTKTHPEMEGVIWSFHLGRAHKILQKALARDYEMSGK
jgi:hypothetical protein